MLIFLDFLTRKNYFVITGNLFIFYALINHIHYLCKWNKPFVMKNKLIILLSALFLCFFISTISAQSILPYDEPFTETLNDWTPSPSSTWSWGTEAIVAGDTFSVISPSGGGAAVLVDIDLPASNDNSLAFENIAIDPATSQNVHLRFNNT